MRKYRFRNTKQGFTLVELMITLLLSIVVSAGIYYSYTNQQKIYRHQEAVVDMQQNLRGGLFMLSQELRMAGYDPNSAGGFAIVNATPTVLNFTQDLDGDGVPGGLNENITLTFNPPILPATGNITRNTGGGAQPFIDNVDFLELAYTLEDGTVTLNPPAGFFDEIISIQVAMLVRSPLQELNIFNNLPYTSDFGTAVPGAPFNDNFRRRMLNTTIQCRNASI